jgi:hypothetical protein
MPARDFTDTTPVHQKTTDQKTVYNAHDRFISRCGCTPKMETKKKVYKPQQLFTAFKSNQLCIGDKPIYRISDKGHKALPNRGFQLTKRWGRLSHCIALRTAPAGGKAWVYVQAGINRP